MRRIYSDYIVKPNSKECNKHFLKIATAIEEKKTELNEDEYIQWCIDFHEYIRQDLGLPNKVFGILINNEKREACIATFPKKPDGKNYKCYIDDELSKIYILVDDGYRFDTYFIDSSDLILQVDCRCDNGSYHILINTYKDPYTLYYEESNCPDNIEEFRKALFDYLKEKYPTIF